MPWFQVDDGFADHPKVIDLMDRDRGPHALSLWLLAGSWCAKHLTDGLLTLATVKRLGFGKDEADELVNVGLWKRSGTAYRFHDWSRCNRTKEQVEHDRAKNRSKQQDFQARKRPQPVTRDPDPDNPVTNHPPNQVSDSVSDEVSNTPPLHSTPNLSNPREEKRREVCVNSSHLPTPQEIGEARHTPWRRVFEIWTKHAHGGKPIGDPGSNKNHCEKLLKDARLLRPGDPFSLIDEVAGRYIPAKRTRGQTPEIRYFAADFAGEADKPAPNGSKPVTPELAEYRRLRVERSAALKASDDAKVHDCELKLLEIQKGWDNARRL